MALIDRDNFDILEHYDIEQPDRHFFECDEELAPVISLLNRKGYRTLYCCSSHLYDSISDTMQPDDPGMSDSEITDTIPGVMKIIRDNDDIKVVTRQNLDLKSYIMFSSDTVLPSVPDGWRLEYRNTLSHNFYWDDAFQDTADLNELKEKPYFFYRRRLELLEVLYHWAETLPVHDPDLKIPNPETMSKQTWRQGPLT